MIIYRLEGKGPQLFVKLEEQGSKRILYADTLKALAKAKDAPAVQFLAKLHLRANAGRSIDTLSFQEILIPPKSSNEAIRLMADTGRLHIRGNPIQVSAKRAKLIWKGELHSEKSATLEAFIEDEPLSSVDLLFGGDPLWAVVKGVWREIDTTASLRWVEYFSKGPATIEGVEKKRFLEEVPHIQWNQKQETSPLQVFPLLILSDITGSFANLWMDYPRIGRVAFEDLAPQIGGKTRLKLDEAAFEKDLVEAGYLRKTVGGSRYYCPGEKVQETLQFLLEVGWRCSDAQGRTVLLQSGYSMNISEESSIRVRSAVHFQEKEGSMRQAKAALQKGRLFVEIDSGSVGLLNGKSLPILEGIWDGEELVLPNERIGDLSSMLGRKEVVFEAPLEQSVRVLDKKSEFGPVLLDDRFCGKLLPYQQTGVEWLFFLQKNGFNALLSDEMGLGKTVQVLAFFSQLRTNLPVLIVAPTSLLFNWRFEISRFWPSAKVYVHSGPDRLTKSESIQSQGVVLTSYALLRQDLNLLSPILFEAAVLDESQSIKSSESLAAKAACGLTAKFKIAMTGTPIENRPEELWSQFCFLMPDLLGTKSNFLATSSESVRRRVKPFILKRSKSEVQINLPEKMDQPLWIEMTETQQSLYDQTWNSFKSGLLRKIEADGLSAHRMEVLEVILRLRQISCDGRLAGELEIGAKAKTLISMAEEWASIGKKSLVFSQFTTWLRLLEKDLQEAGIETIYLDGSTSSEMRGELVRKFQEESKPYLFLLSLKAGGVGLNLTAAQNVVLLDPWWNEAVERQAVDRAHRIGQKNTLWVHRMLTPGAIEEKILSLKGRKTAFADEFLEGEAWTQDDLMDLLN